MSSAPPSASGRAARGRGRSAPGGAVDRAAATPAANGGSGGGLSTADAWILAILAALPLVTITLRMLALPGFGPAALGSAGDVLDRVLSLSDVPPSQRDHVLYLLFVPTCALLVALARLTFGLRILGFRSILMSVAFHQSGVAPSLLLIAIAVVTVLLLRPWLRHLQLPYYARISVILCVAAMTMVGALLAGPWVSSDITRGMAYFPVIVLGMTAEGIARSADRDGSWRALWLAINTVVLALVMVLVCRIPLLRGFVLRFPEIVLTQIVAIVLIAEFFQLRIADSRKDSAERASIAGRPARERVVVVRNRVERGRGVRPMPGTPRSVQKIVDGLRAAGYAVRVAEGTPELPATLRRHLPADPVTGRCAGIVFNLAAGAQGDTRPAQVPAVLEMSGVAYSGPTPLGHAILQDRLLSRALIQRAGIPTPAFRLVANARGDTRGLRYPVIVRPRRATGTRAVLARNRRELVRRARGLVRRHRQEAFVEERASGRRIHVALLGNDPIECLPLVEVDGASDARICPASLDESTVGRIRERAEAAFRVCGGRDYGRVEVCVDSAGEVWVVEVRALGILAAEGSFARAAREAGLSFAELLGRIVEITRRRARSEERRAAREVALHAVPAT